MNIDIMFIKRAIRFSCSGLFVTAVHVLIVALCVEMILLSPPLANGIAFMIATVISYLINTKWSFKRQVHGKNFFRFCVVSCIGLFLAVSISATAQYYGINYWGGVFFVVCSIAPLTFLLHNFWTYR